MIFFLMPNAWIPNKAKVKPKERIFMQIFFIEQQYDQLVYWYKGQTRACYKQRKQRDLPEGKVINYRNKIIFSSPSILIKLLKPVVPHYVKL